MTDMSGETEAQESGWTVDTHKYYVDLQIAAMTRRFDDLQQMLEERYRTQTKAIDAAFTAQQTAMQTAFTAADKAVNTALVAQERAVDKALQASEAAITARQNTADREFHEHLDQVRHENQLAFVNSDKAISAAFAASDRAISKAETATEKRFESVNEFRAQLNDAQRTLMPRAEWETSHGNLAEAVNELKDRMNRAEGQGVGKNQLWGYVATAIAIIGTIVIVTNVLIGR